MNPLQKVKKAISLVEKKLSNSRRKIKNYEDKIDMHAKGRELTRLQNRINKLSDQNSQVEAKLMRLRAMLANGWHLKSDEADDALAWAEGLQGDGI